MLAEEVAAVEVKEELPVAVEVEEGGNSMGEGEGRNQGVRVEKAN